MTCTRGVIDDGVIVAVQDNVVNRSLLKMMMQRMGAQVTAADNGAEAVDIVSTTPVDIVLMDCQVGLISKDSAACAHDVHRHSS